MSDGGRANKDASAPISLGRLVIHPAARILLRDGAPVELGSRAFDILMTLLNARGQIVSKEAMMKEVWSSTIVGEGNLSVQLSRVRQALGEERWRIKTIPGRGHILIVDAGAAEPQPATGTATATATKDLAVVFIDGSAENREHLRRVLINAGVRVENLSSLAAALDQAAAQGGEPSARPSASDRRNRYARRAQRGQDRVRN